MSLQSGAQTVPWRNREEGFLEFVNRLKLEILSSIIVRTFFSDTTSTEKVINL